MTTLVPAPMFGGQSPGRGEAGLGAGGGEGGGTGACAGSADDEPQPAAALAIPIAAIARNIAEPPTARPMDARNSRRAMRGSVFDMLLLSYPLNHSDHAQPLKFPIASLYKPVAIAALAMMSALVKAEALTVAVASNFAQTARELTAVFEQETGAEVRLSIGSTGKLFAQIMNGAPYDVFLAADTARPRALEMNSRIVEGSRFTYAEGVLAFWSSTRDVRNCMAVLGNLGDEKIAIANPVHAPYGIAAMNYLQQQPWFEDIADNLVYGENVAQAFQFVATGNADYGFVALSSLIAEQKVGTSCNVAANDALLQEAVILSRAGESDDAHKFAAFLASDTARTIISDSGYKLPEP